MKGKNRVVINYSFALKLLDGALKSPISLKKAKYGHNLPITFVR